MLHYNNKTWQAWVNDLGKILQYNSIKTWHAEANYSPDSFVQISLTSHSPSQKQVHMLARAIHQNAANN